jgi:hypothetical protein
MRKRLDGHLRRPAAELTSLVHSGVDKTIGLVADSECTQHLAVPKIMHGGFDARSITVRIKGAAR